MSDKLDNGKVKMDLESLLEALEEFPLDYYHKLMGRNTEQFHEGVRRLEDKFPELKKESARLSKGDRFLALTYHFTAQSPAHVREVIEATRGVPDLLMIL